MATWKSRQFTLFNSGKLSYKEEGKEADKGWLQLDGQSTVEEKGKATHFVISGSDIKNGINKGPRNLEVHADDMDSLNTWMKNIQAVIDSLP